MRVALTVTGKVFFAFANAHDLQLNRVARFGQRPHWLNIDWLFMQRPNGPLKFWPKIVVALQLDRSPKLLLKIIPGLNFQIC